MRNVKLDNSDLLAYFDTIEKLKQQPSMDEYLEGYSKVCEEYPFGTQVDKYRSAYNELRRLDKKRQSLIDNFVIELNPISSSTARTAAKSSCNLDIMHERMIYQRAISEKTDAEIVALVIKQRTEAALEFKRSVEQSLEQLSSISSDIGASNTKRRKMAV
ncbi:DUF4756 family protein [Pectobacterium versatile]|uniref:DUF4756 family protein n=1 Tax=Pectobacterium versatile TaxID=2488639 RepID=A0AAW3RS98_9GAMM|nr:MULTISPECIES: DUF4756 family protein [Pectobacterium]MBA0159427.1 DUF4756 family protein [Pectobacterium versatile]MBQ4778554.1 DUF4756 family protein [Pectobacterium versatile]MCH5051772.1 DUF4756 family protein [Pectobacterium aquaticum]PWD64326.1 DUF4756 domain-containing protein [Pectobacterium atrosepticum]QWC51671.1 DUF4756 family protein [Pectobacterium atrosepticum]